MAEKAEAALRSRNPGEIRDASADVAHAPRFSNLPARSALPGSVYLSVMTASVALGAGYLGYVDRTLWEPARYRHATAGRSPRIDGDPVSRLPAWSGASPVSIV